MVGDPTKGNGGVSLQNQKRNRNGESGSGRRREDTRCSARHCRQGSKEAQSPSGAGGKGSMVGFVQKWGKRQPVPEPKVCWGHFPTSISNYFVGEAGRRG